MSKTKRGRQPGGWVPLHPWAQKRNSTWAERQQEEAKRVAFDSGEAGLYRYVPNDARHPTRPPSEWAKICKAEAEKRVEAAGASAATARGEETKKVA